MGYKYVAGYLRLSRDDEDKKDESNSIKNQRLLIRQFIDSMGDFEGAEIRFFSDDGYSGANYGRPGFAEMMELVKRESPCCIIVKDLSRLGRDTIDTQNYIEKVFPFLQVRFIAINDYFDSSDTLASRKDTEAKFKNLVNGIYPQICSRNIKQVMRKQAEAGKYHGAIPPYGYMFNGKDRTSLLVDKDVSWVVRLIFDKRLAGEGYAGIARFLNGMDVTTPAEYLRRKGFLIVGPGVASMWTGDMVSKILENPIYTGAIVNHKTENAVVAVKSAASVPKEEWVCVPDMHGAIVKPEEMDKVLSMKKHGTYHPACGASRNIFIRKLKCGHCRRALRVRSEARMKNVRFSCRTPGRCSGAQCYKGISNLSDLESLVLALVKQQAAIADDSLKKIKEVNKTLDIPKLKRKRDRYGEKIRQGNDRKMELYEQYAMGELTKDGFLKGKEKISLEMAGYKEKAAVLDDEIAKLEKEKRKEDSLALRNFARYMELDALSYEIVQELVDVIYFYDPEHVEVIWNFRDEFVEAAGNVNRNEE